MKINKNFILIFLKVMSASLLAQSGEQPSGSGTEADPYLVGTLNNLYWMTENSGEWDKYYVQTSNMLLLPVLGMTDRVLHLWAIIPSSSPALMMVTGIPLTVYLSIARQVVELDCLGASALTATALPPSKTWA